MRIAFGGIPHETNTFAPSQATYADFAQADGWPGLTTGAAIFAAVAGVVPPIAEDILVVAAPGPNPLDHNELTYKNLRPGVRVMPRGG